MRKVHWDKYGLHQQVSKFLQKIQEEWASDPILNVFIGEYIRKVDRTNKMILGLKKPKGSITKNEMRKALVQEIRFRIAPFLCRIVLAEKDEQLFKWISVTQKSLENMPVPKFLDFTEKLVFSCERYIDRYQTDDFNSQQLECFKQKLQEFHEVVPLPQKQKAAQGKLQKYIVKAIQELNADVAKLDTLLLAFKEKKNEVYQNYLKSRIKYNVHGSRYAVLGKILDKSTGLPVAGAQVVFKGTNIIRKSSPQGHVWLKKFPNGSYRIEVTHPEYQTKAGVIHYSHYERNERFRIALEPLVVNSSLEKKTEMGRG